MIKFLSKWGAPLLMLAIIFVACGDRATFLPLPVRQASYNARLALYGLGGKLVPGWTQDFNPNERTEDAVEGVEQSQ